MTSTMDLADMFAAADSAEHHSCLFGMPDDFQAAIADKQKARAALEQRIKELEADALRYRWLRDEATSADWVDLGLEYPREDYMVHRAMSETGRY